MQAAQYVTAQNQAVTLATRALRSLWAATGGLSPLDRRVALESIWPELVAQFGQVTVDLAAAQFEELTGMSASVAGPVDPGRANARLRWGLGPLFENADEAGALARLVQLVDELVKQPGRDTMADSATKNKIRFARVPSGAETCMFCLMLASRGAVYGSARTAGQMKKFHGDCDCRIEPVRNQGDLDRLIAGGYDLEGFERMYADARKAAGSGDTSKILAAMRDRRGTD